MDDDLRDLSDQRLIAEFDRIAQLKENCEASLANIRKEQSRRKDLKLAALDAKMCKTCGYPVGHCGQC